MKKEIEEIIEKNLPAQVGTTLKKRLIQAEVDAESVKELQNIVDVRNKTIKGLTTEVSAYAKLDDDIRAMDKRFEVVAQRENDLAVSELTYQLEAEKEKTTFAKEVALGLVRNTEFRKTAYGSGTVVSNDSTGYPVSVPTTDNSDTIDKAE